MNIILGCGVTGLILKCLDIENKYYIVGSDLGGQFNSSFNMGPRILKHTIESDNFLNFIGLKKEKKLFKVGYYYEGLIHNETSEKYREMYFHKTRGFNKKFENSSMNDGVSSFYGYDITKDDILFLYNKIKNYFYFMNVNKISMFRKELHGNWDNEDIMFNYDKMIITVPINTFYKLSSIDKIIRYDPVTFYKINKYFLKHLGKIDDYDFIYFPTDEYKFHRITKLNKDYFCIESKNDFIDYYEDKIILKNAILKDDDVEICYDEFDLKFCGRYAKASHDVRMHDIIKIAKDIL